MVVFTMARVPTALASVSITPVGRASFSMAEGGPVSPSTFVYTMTNTEASVVDWGVSHTQTWMSVIPAGGSMPPFGSQAVTVTVERAASHLTGETYVDTLTFTLSSSPSPETRTVSLTLLPPMIYAFNLDTNPSWPLQGEWTFGHPKGQGGASHGFPDPNNGFTGTNVIGVNLNGDYSIAIGGPYYLTAGPFDFSESTHVTLGFQRWLNTDGLPWLSATIDVSTNGTSWNALWSNTGEEISEDTWSHVVHDVSAYADRAPRFYVRWGYGVHSLNPFAYSGWNIDDVRFHGRTGDGMQVLPNDGLTSQGYQGGPFSPTSKTYVVSNSVLATDSMTWTGAASEPWITVSPAGGVLPPGGTTGVNVMFNDAATALSIGIHPATATFSNTLSGGVQMRSVSLTVRGDLAFGSAAYSAGEAAAPAVITVRRDGDTNRAVTVDFATHDGTATAGLDYVTTNGTLSFAAGETIQTFAVQILDDAVAEDHETVNLVLSNATSGGTLGDPVTATLTIVDDDLSTVAYLRSSTGAPFWGSTNNESAMDVVFGAGNWQDLRYETVNPTNLLSSSSTFIFMEGSDRNASVLEAFLTANSNAVERWVDAGGLLFLNAAPNEGDGMSFGFGVTLNYPVFTSSGAAVDTNHTIFTTPFTPVGNAWTGSSFGHATVSGGGVTALITNTVNGNIVLAEMDHGAGRVLFGGMTTANYHTPQPEANHLRANIIAYGSTLSDSLIVTPASTKFVSAGYAGGPFAPSNTLFTLANAGPSSLTWLAGCASNWIRVTPESGTLTAGATVDVMVAIHESAPALAVGIYNATVAFSNEASGVARIRSASLTVQGDITLELPDPADEAGGEAAIVVHRDGNTHRAVTVDFATHDGTATAGLDYVTTNGTLSFAAGETVKRFDIPVLNDDGAEGNETVNVVLSNPTGGGTLGNPSVATLTISDDDGGPISLPYDLQDGSNYLWDIQGDGRINNGTIDAYDGGLVLDGFPPFANGLLMNARQIILGPATNGSVRMTRKIYVPTNHAFCRFLEVLENVGDTRVTQRVRLDTNLGSDSGTIIDSTSSGDTSFGVDDDWIVTDDADGSGDPTVAHVVANDSGQQRASAVNYSTGILGYEYDVVLNPGETRIVMHFGAQNPTRSMARINAAGLAALEGDALALMSPAEFSQVVNFGILDAANDLISSGSTWLYHNNGAGPGSNWYGAAFADDVWSSGAAPLGYPLGDKPVSTLLSYGGDPANTWATYYFRTHVVVTNRASVTGLLARFIADDGAVIYLNGTRVHTTTNIIEPAANDTWCTASKPEPYERETFTINPDMLVTGTNVLAAEVHQMGPASSDVYFDLSLTKVTYPTTNQVGGGYSPPGNWTLYNDALWMADDIVGGFTGSFTTNNPFALTNGTLMSEQGAILSSIGVSMRTNASLATVLSLTNTLAIPWPADTDAANEFEGKIGRGYACELQGTSPLSAITVTLSGLQSTKQYKLVVWASRLGASSSYTNRYTDIILSDMDSFTNNSTVAEGVTRFSTATNADSTTVRSVLRAGYGPVARFEQIRPGADGNLVFQVRRSAASAGNGYFNAFKLVESDVPVSGDGDGDGMDDAWEVLCFGGTGVARSGPREDFDDDGSCNYDEYRAGTNPTNATSKLAITRVVSAPAPAGLVLNWASQTGRSYSILSSTNLFGAWNTHQMGVPATAPGNVYTTPGIPSKGYWRVRVE